MLCQECSKKETCQELCPEAEIYVDQDRIPQAELTVGFDITNYIEPLSFVSSIHLTKKEKEILTLLGKGLGRGDVCQLLEMSRDTFRVHIANLKKKWQKN